MPYHTFEEHLDYLLLERHDNEAYEAKISEKYKEFYNQTVTFLESPEPKSHELPVWCYNKHDGYVEIFGRYETSIITYFIDDVLNDKGLYPEEYEQSIKFGLPYNNFVEAQQHKLTCEEHVQTRKNGVFCIEFVEFKKNTFEQIN